jgi:hypothetical protein
MSLRRTYHPAQSWRRTCGSALVSVSAQGAEAGLVDTGTTDNLEHAAEQANISVSPPAPPPPVLVQMPTGPNCPRCLNPVLASPPVPVAPINFRIPCSLQEAPVDALLCLSANKRCLILSGFARDVLDGLNALRIAALDPEDIAVPRRGSEQKATVITPPANYCTSCKLSHVRNNQPQDDRWYIIYCGRAFTGVVRGTALYQSLAIGATGVSGKRVLTQEQAEHGWKVGYYAGTCAMCTWEEDGSMRVDTIMPERTYAM